MITFLDTGTWLTLAYDASSLSICAELLLTIGTNNGERLKKLITELTFI